MAKRYQIQNEEFGHETAHCTIKKERITKDNKQTPQDIIAELQSASYSGRDTFNDTIQIKNEEDTKIKQLFKEESNGVFNNGPQFYCRLCKVIVDSPKLLYQHRTAVHGMKYYKSSSIKHKNMIPDIYDPDFYCKACETTSKTNSIYRVHLRRIHHMVLPAFFGPKNDSIPDPNNTNQYCCACERRYSKRAYRAHLKLMHMIKFPESKTSIKNPDIFPEWTNPNNYCRSCEFTYKTKDSFHSHCKVVHLMQPPNQNPVGCYYTKSHCQMCRITFTTKTSFRKHCRFFHPQYGVRSDKVSTAPLPDISDPNNYCRGCNKIFTNKYTYKEHLQYVHRIMGPPSLSIIEKNEDNNSKFLCYSCNKTVANKINFKKHLVTKTHCRLHNQTAIAKQPDVDDPQFYCRTCIKTYSSKQNYRDHLLKVHSMYMLPQIQRKGSSNHLPDPLDPNNYCKVCKKTYSSKDTYRRHCKLIHRMILTPTKMVYTKPEVNRHRTS